VIIIRRLLHGLFGGFKMRYLPLLMVYFAFGAQGISSIALSFWIKDHLQMSAAAIAGVTFWANIPWTMKIVFGQLVDGVKILGSQRKAYIYLGAGLQIVATTVLVRIAGGLDWFFGFSAVGRVLDLFPVLTQGQLYLVFMVLTAAGFMIQDVVADTMSTEVVDRVDSDTGVSKSEEEINRELGQVQWLGRLFLMAAVIGTGGVVAGFLAGIFKGQLHIVFTINYALPIISLVGVLFVRLNPVPSSPLNWQVLGGGAALGIFATTTGLLLGSYSQVVVLVVSFVFLVYLIRKVGLGRSIALAAATIFIYRAMPGAGPGVNWWMIDVLKFDEDFFGVLGQITSILGVVGLLVFRKTITERPLRFTLLWLTMVGAVVSLPTIGLYYGVHEMLGVGARTVAFFDTAISAPLGQLSMVPMLVIIARSCPVGQAATQFALMASLMNVALSASDLGAKFLNTIYVVKQQQVDAAGIIVQMADYSQLGHLLIITWAIGLLVPLVAILVLLRNTGPARPGDTSS